MITARMLAYQILLHLDQKPSHPDRLIRAMLDRHSRMEERDRALLTELVYGVLRWQGRLDWHIDQVSKIASKKIDPAIRILLRLALYQVLLLDRIPAHAAVNEAVKIAKATQPAHRIGFVNAVLREALRRQDSWDYPAAEKDPEDHLAVTTSHPAWFVRKFLKELGFEETKRFCEANNTIAPMVLRVNTLKTTAAEVLDRLHEEAVEAEPSPCGLASLRVSGLRQDVTRLSIYGMGWIQVQDEASQLISYLVAPRSGERVLDLCSGFGGKSTHLALLMGNEGEVVSVDKSAWKLEELRENAERQSVTIVRPRAGDALELSDDALGGRFDRVLLDAPCSGFGSLRRNPDIKWRRHPKDPYRFGQLQLKLLDRAAGFVKPGGVLVYATCTLSTEEDEEVARHFGETHPDWVLEPAAAFLHAECAAAMTEGGYFKSWPHRHDMDGFFGARWRRGA